jgi:hypothetical protein
MAASRGRYEADRPATAAENDARLAALLAEHGATRCRHCGAPVDRGALAWNNRVSDYGTPWTHVFLRCPACDRGLAAAHSWRDCSGHLDDEEAVGVVLGILADGWEE